MICSSLESCMRRNAPVQFGKGATEKGWEQYLVGALLHFGKGITKKVRKEPRRYPTSFGRGLREKGWQQHLALSLPYTLVSISCFLSSSLLTSFPYHLWLFCGYYI